MEEEVAEKLLQYHLSTDGGDADLKILRAFARSVAEEAAKLATTKLGSIRPSPEFRIRRWSKEMFGERGD